MPHLSRTDFVLQISKQHINALPSTDPNKALLGVLHAFLVCISFYSEMEIKIIEMVKKRLSVSGDQKITNFIVNTQKRILARLAKSDIADCVALFGDEARDAFN